ncbi:MAG: phosphoribosyl-ATP diphosphatase [Pseudomonadota bacterium]
MSAAPDQDALAVIRRLEAVIAARKAEGDAGASHTARLLAKGRSKCAQKLGEEAVETAIAAAEGDRAAVTSESADLLFHLLVLLASMDLSLDDVAAELARREGVSGLAEKAARRE